MQSVGYKVFPAALTKVSPSQNQNHNLDSLPKSSPVHSKSEVPFSYQYHPIQFSGKKTASESKDSESKDRTKKIKNEYIPKLIKGLPRTAAGHQITMDDFHLLSPIKQLKNPSADELDQAYAEISKPLSGALTKGKRPIGVFLVEDDKVKEKYLDGKSITKMLSSASQVLTQVKSDPLTSLDQFLAPTKDDTLYIIEFLIGDAGNKKLCLATCDNAKAATLMEEAKRQEFLLSAQQNK